MGNNVVDFLKMSHMEPMDPAKARRATRLAVSFNIAFLVVAILLVSFTLFGKEWIFRGAGFTGWCVMSFMWVRCSMVIRVIWPVVESWGTIVRIGRGMVRDLGTWGRAEREGREGKEIEAMWGRMGMFETVYGRLAWLELAGMCRECMV